MTDGTKHIKDFFFREKGVDIDCIDYKPLPEKKASFNISKVIGNINLIAGRIKTDTEARSAIDSFIHAPIP